MMQLICDRPPFIRLTGFLGAGQAEELFCCPVHGQCGQICALTPRPCAVHTAAPFETFASIAAATGREEARLAAFNSGGAVYPTRKIYLYDMDG